MSGLDRNNRQTWSRLQHTVLIRKGSIKYCLLLLWAPEDFPEEVLTLRDMTSDAQTPLAHATMLRDTSGFQWHVSPKPVTCQWMPHVWGFGKRTVGSARDGDWRRWLSRSDITFLRKLHGLVKKHSYFMQSVCTLLWTDCFKTYMVVT